MIKDTFKISCDFRCINLDESTDLKKQKAICDSIGKDSNGKQYNIRTFVNKSTCRVRRQHNNEQYELPKPVSQDFGAEMHAMKMKLPNKWISKRVLTTLLDDEQETQSMRSIIRRKNENKKAEA